MAKLNKFKRAACFAVGLGFLTLFGSGCATTGGYAQQNSSITSCYDQFFSSYGEYRVVRKGSHLVRQKMDCTENTEIPYESYATPGSRLVDASYSKDGRYILWCTQRENPSDYVKYFRIDSNLDTKTIQKISGYEYDELEKKENPR